MARRASSVYIRYAAAGDAAVQRPSDPDPHPCAIARQSWEASMEGPMDAHVNVAVFYHSETAQLLHLALAAADGALDAGGEVRVRRIGRRDSAARMSPRADPIPFPRDGERSQQAGAADLEWADVALFGTATPYGVRLDPPTRFIDATVPLWLAGK